MTHSPLTLHRYANTTGQQSSADMGRDGMAYNPELPMGGAFDIGRLDGSTSLDNGSSNGNASNEFYHSGKNKGSLRFDRY